MAVKLVTSIQNFIGLHGDDKPTSCPAGSIFWEEDRNKTYKFNGTTWDRAFPQLDRIAHGGLLTVDVIHNEVHSDHLYSAPFVETLSSGSSSTILLETPGSAVATIHILATISATASGTLIFQKIPNATVGTVVASYNHNLAVSTSAELSITHSGAVITVGTFLEGDSIGQGGQAKIGGKSGLTDEWMLDHDARYLLQFVASAATTVNWNIIFYEEPA